MTATALLSLKQQLTKLSERERREIAAFLIRLRHESPEWKRRTAKTIREMQAGKQTSLDDLKKRLRNAK